MFLHRSHALPLPYLLTPSQSFLVYLSPLTYLTTLQCKPSIKDESDPFPLDIPLSHIRKTLSDNTKGATIATLLLSPTQNPILKSSIPLSTILRPVFPLVGSGSELNHTFPQLDDAILLTSSGQYEWVLDFTNNGKTKGIVVSQARMREIERVVNPPDPFHNQASSSSASGGPFVGESWVDVLVRFL